jgi:ribosomal protein L37AE/L43A
MKSDEKSTVSCESGAHYEGDFSYSATITCPECNKDVHVNHFEWTALECQYCGAVVEKNNWNWDVSTQFNREGTYDYHLRRMKEDNALKKQVGGQHYKDCSIQPVEYIFQNGLDYFEGNVVKYITRHRKKGEGKKDVEKAIHYAQLILELYYDE